MRRFRSIKAYPVGETEPEVWILGSSDYGAQVAAYFGLPYAFAWFFSDGAMGAHAMRLYQNNFRPSERHPDPTSGLCVFALTASTEEEAAYHFMPRARFRLFRERGIFEPLVSPEEVMAADYSEADQARMAQFKDAAFVGTPEKVAERIQALGRDLGIDEMALVTWAYDEGVRHQSYRLLADAFGLEMLPAAAE